LELLQKGPQKDLNHSKKALGWGQRGREGVDRPFPAALVAGGEELGAREEE